MYFKRKAGSKYNNTKTKYNGIAFASKLELKYYLYLLDLQQKKIIKDLILQPIFVIQLGFRSSKQYKISKKAFDIKEAVYTAKKKLENNIKPIKYIADFQYLHIEQDTVYIVDTKGFQTPDYKIKKKMFLEYLESIRFEKNTIFCEVS